MGLFTVKKSATRALDDMKTALLRELGDELETLLVFGSFASGEFDDKKSNLNLFVVLRDSNAQTLHKLRAPFRKWVDQGHPTPVFVQSNELAAYARALPIEFLDMRDYHQLLHGADPFPSLALGTANLHAQCEQELALKLLKLRQAVTLLADKPRELERVFQASASSVLSLFRAVLRLTEPVHALKKGEAAERLAKQVPFDPGPLLRLTAPTLRRTDEQPLPFAARYLDIIEHVMAYLGRI